MSSFCKPERRGRLDGCIRSLIFNIFSYFVLQYLPNGALNRVRSSTSPLNFKYPLPSSRSSNSWLSPPPGFSVTSHLPSVFPYITCYRRQFLSNMWPVRLDFLILIVYAIILPYPNRILSFFISHATGPTDLLVTSTATYFKSFQVFIINFWKQK